VTEFDVFSDYHQIYDDRARVQCWPAPGGATGGAVALRRKAPPASWP
jgi:hypothetical protein